MIRGTVMTKRNCLVFFLITALIFTMCSVSVFATEGETAPDSTAQTETGNTAEDTATGETAADDTATDGAETGDDAVSSDDAASDDTAATDDESKADDTTTTGEGETEKADDESESETEGVTGEEHEHEEEGTQKKGLSTTAIVLLAVFGAIILIFAVLYLFKPKFRERVKKFFREYKSVLKKVVWSSKADVIKNTKIVIIGIVAIAVVVGLVDIGLANLIDLIGKIGK